MSWLATKYAWKCRHEDVKGSIRLVMLAIALRVRKNFVSTLPTSMKALCRLTFLSDDQVRRCLDELVRIGEVRRLRRGKYATYAMVKMAGPLFACDLGENPQDAEFFESEKTPQDAGISNRKMRGFSALRSVGHLSSDVVRTRVLTTTHDEPTAAEAFLAYWARIYPIYSNGAQATIDLERDGPIVALLIERRGLERVKAMATALLLINVHDDPWIAKSDRSLRVLNHKADWLDRRLTTIADWWIACPHVPKCDARAGCQAHEAVG